MLKIGLTGGIGSGKSLVARIFENIGIPVYNSDLRARELMSTDQALAVQIIKLLGPHAYKNCFPDRKYIAEKVFNNKDAAIKWCYINQPLTVGFEN